MSELQLYGFIFILAIFATMISLSIETLWDICQERRAAHEDEVVVEKTPKLSEIPNTDLEETIIIARVVIPSSKINLHHGTHRKARV